MLLIDKDNYKLSDNELTEYLLESADKHGFSDINSITTNQFNVLLCDIGSKFFNNNILYNHNHYSLDENIIDLLSNYYIYICSLYNKCISMYNFCNMINVESELLEVWKSADVTSLKFKVIKKLTDKREQYIKDKLTDSNNVVGAIAVANNEYKWTNGSNAGNTTINVLSGSSLPDLIAKIADNNGVQALPPSKEM
jgi:hypothetical protein